MISAQSSVPDNQRPMIGALPSLSQSRARQSGRARSGQRTSALLPSFRDVASRLPRCRIALRKASSICGIRL